MLCKLSSAGFHCSTATVLFLLFIKVMAGYPSKGRGRGVHVLKLMKAVCPILQPELVEMWDTVIPKLLQYLEGTWINMTLPSSSVIQQFTSITPTSPYQHKNNVDGVLMRCCWHRLVSSVDGTLGDFGGMLVKCWWSVERCWWRVGMLWDFGSVLVVCW